MSSVHGVRRRASRPIWIGGDLRAESDGKGSTFVLTLARAASS